MASSFFTLIAMRYFYEKILGTKTPKHGKIYRCDHPVYDVCTLYLVNGRGLAVIQQRYDQRTKSTRWTEVDPELADDLYLSDGFDAVFERYGGKAKDGLYPTLTLRQIMWALKMKPIKKEVWETVFDHKPI